MDRTTEVANAATETANPLKSKSTESSKTKPWMGRGGELSPRMADSAFFSPAANVTMPLVENCELVTTMGGARSAPQTRAISKKAGPQKVLRAVGPAIKLD